MTYHWSRTFDNPAKNAIMFSLFIILIIIIGVVIFTDLDSFSENLAAEVIGICLTFLLALLIFDWLAIHQGEQEWFKVRNLTYGTIAAILCDALSLLMIEFVIKDTDNKIYLGIVDGRDKPNDDAIKAMDKLARELNKLELLEGDKILKYYNLIQHDLDRISDVLIPRIIQCSSDQDIITDLIDLDNSKNDLHSKIRYEHEDIILGRNLLTLFVLSSICAYKSICKEWTGSEQVPRGT